MLLHSNPTGSLPKVYLQMNKLLRQLRLLLHVEILRTIYLSKEFLDKVEQLVFCGGFDCFYLVVNFLLNEPNILIIIIFHLALISLVQTILPIFLLLEGKSPVKLEFTLRFGNIQHLFFGPLNRLKTLMKLLITRLLTVALKLQLGPLIHLYLSEGTRLRKVPAVVVVLVNQHALDVPHNLIDFLFKVLRRCALTIRVLIQRNRKLRFKLLLHLGLVFILILKH